MPTITRGRGQPRRKPSSEVKGSRGPRPDRRDVHRTTLPGDPTIRPTVPTAMGEENARFDPTGEPDEAKASSPVRRGAAETGPHGNRADRPPYVEARPLPSHRTTRRVTPFKGGGRLAARGVLSCRGGRTPRGSNDRDVTGIEVA